MSLMNMFVVDVRLIRHFFIYALEVSFTIKAKLNGRPKPRVFDDILTRCLLVT